MLTKILSKISFKSLALTILKSLFASIPLSIFLMCIYAASIGFATFVERDYGTIVANDVIYHSFWFEFINVWLLINILGCMYRSAKHGFKISVQIFHLSFVVMIIGAGITRHYGFEGNMSLSDGQSSAFITSSDKFLNVFVSNEIADDGDERDIMPLESFKKGYDIYLSPYVKHSSFKLNEKVFDKALHIESTQIINYSLASLFNEARKENREPSDEELDEKKKENHYMAMFEVEYNGIRKEIMLSNFGNIVSERFGNRYITLSWGQKSVKLPFEIKLDKFEVLNYPGSKMPSSFASYVQVIDNDYKSMDYKIYMNNVLDYKGYRFFQSQYNIEQDEDGNPKEDENGNPIYAGTILSVNKDPGKIPTYIGYTLLILGAIWLLFDRDSRFKKLSDFIKNQKMLFALIVSIGISSNFHTLQADEIPDANMKFEEFKNSITKIVDLQKKLSPILADRSNDAINKRLEGLKKIPKDVLESFSTLQVQGADGRIRIMDTYSDEIMRKITGAKTFGGLNHNQFMIGLMTIPRDMTKLRFIKVKNAEILKLLDIKHGNYISFEDLFVAKDIESVYDFAISQNIQTRHDFQQSYKLFHLVVTALKKPDSERSDFDKEVLKLNEKADFLLPLSVWSYMKIFPQGKVIEDFMNGATGTDKNLDRWQVLGNPIDVEDPFLNYIYMSFSTQGLHGIIDNDWSDFSKTLNVLHDYQRATGGDLYLNANRVKSELWLNKIDIFPLSQYFYIIAGILLFFIALVAIIANKKIPKWLGGGLYFILFIIFCLHTIGLLLRWYIGGHAPWSNAYESMLYIAWASALSGIIILRKSYFAMCGASFLAGMALLIAHWGFMDPQIGNLEPVLNSYWLNIHVAIIVASYGFLGLSLMLGCINLILFIFRSATKPQIDKSILYLTALNEMSMIIGVLMLIVGTFLGGVWANESWGRYWSWDSKETWSLVSVGVYAVILHVRFLKPVYLPYVFNMLSVIGFYSIIMTYFGVNYYLATGLHSYGRGQSDGISEKIYISLIILFVFILISFFKRKLIASKELG